MAIHFKNDRFLRAIRRQPVDVTPIWIMRQAGRYLPEYRRVREEAGSFMTLCKTPALAAEVTLQPLRRFDLDAAIIFSDILTIPDALGLDLHFVEGKGPVFDGRIQSMEDIKRLRTDVEDNLDYVYEAIRETVAALDGKVPLIGFTGSPFTVAAYMIEGRSNPGFPGIMAMCREAPSLLHHLLALLTKSITRHLCAQVASGASVLMVFDTWGGLLSTEDYRLFSLGYLKEIVAGIREAYNREIPVILFAKAGGRFLPQLVETACDALGVDWEVSLRVAKEQVGGRVALQGNLNPSVLLSTPDEIRQAVSAVLADAGKGSGHVFNLGHGITPDVPPDHVAVLVDAVHTLSRPYHNDTN